MVIRVKTGVDELDEIIEGGFPKRSLILLVGEPGTGKTVFCMQFLVKGCELGESCIYVSFNESKDTLIENLSRHLNVDLNKFESEGKLKILDFAAMKEGAISIILETILSEVKSLKAERLVIDSFSVMAQAFREAMDVRIVLHTVLNKIVKQMNCTTLIIEEAPIGESKIGLGIEEFVVDGIIMLKRSELKKRFFRELEVIKLRGVELKERKLVFTLKNGFKVFPIFKLKPVKPKRFQPIPEQPDKYSTGSNDLDEILNGGITKGSIVLFEVDEKVSISEYHLVMAPIAIEFVFQGRGVIIVPSAGVDIEVLKNTSKNYGVTDEEFNSFLRVAEVGIKESERIYPNIIALKGKDWREDIYNIMEASKELNAVTNQPNLYIIGLDILSAYHGEKACEIILTRLATRIRKSKAVLIALIKGHKDLATRVMPIADFHLRILKKHGCLLLYGVKPRTRLYGVEFDVSKGYPLPKFTAIV
ncbi:MAG: ATPase domain-containing protein [Candidatus Bathyarchaeia archaeon]